MPLLNAPSEGQPLKKRLAKERAASKLARHCPGKDSPLWRTFAITLIEMLALQIRVVTTMSAYYALAQVTQQGTAVGSRKAKEKPEYLHLRLE